jgi:hypothetical protein
VTDTPEIAAARIEVERRRARMMGVATELQHRLAPSTLARNTWEGAKEKGADLAEDAVDAVRARPIAATGIVAAVTMFLARAPLMNLAGKLVRKDKVKNKAKTKAKPKKTDDSAKAADKKIMETAQ